MIYFWHLRFKAFRGFYFLEYGYVVLLLAFENVGESVLSKFLLSHQHKTQPLLTYLYRLTI